VKLTRTFGQVMPDGSASVHKGSRGTNLCALCTIILYFRNHIHAGKTAMRKTYFVDLYVAKDLKIATDTVISELLRATGVNFAPTS
jgi:hypothetical protein